VSQLAVVLAAVTVRVALLLVTDTEAGCVVMVGAVELELEFDVELVLELELEPLESSPPRRRVTGLSRRGARESTRLGAGRLTDSFSCAAR
jgi:hypothetical protein